VASGGSPAESRSRSVLERVGIVAAVIFGAAGLVVSIISAKVSSDTYASQQAQNQEMYANKVLLTNYRQAETRELVQNYGPLPLLNVTLVMRPVDVFHSTPMESVSESDATYSFGSFPPCSQVDIGSLVEASQNLPSSRAEEGRIPFIRYVDSNARQWVRAAAGEPILIAYSNLRFGQVQPISIEHLEGCSGS
jgi:hypothetical protein